MPGTSQARHLVLGRHTVDLVRATIEGPGGTVTLTAQEVDLLRALAERGGATVPRTELLQRVMGYAPTSASRALDAAIRRLRDKIEADPRHPVHLQTVYGEGYRLALGAQAQPTQLPVWAGELVGRGQIIDELTRTLAGARLVTVSGPPGVGKSRVVGEVARRLSATDGVVLAYVSVPFQVDAARLAAQVAGAVGLEQPLDPIAEVGARLRRDPGVLLVLDGAEASLAATVELVRDWLAASDTVRFLVSSRERVAVEAEVEVPLPPLDIADAAALLQSRAAGVAGTGWGRGHDEQLEELATCLDGLPLALELAASRADMMTPAQMLARLAEPFALLRRVSWHGDDRHRTLEAAIAWSWALLEPEEQHAMMRLSVLRGPFTTELGERVGGTDLDMLAGLVRKNLVQPVPTEGRLRLLDVVRAYARLQSKPGGTPLNLAFDELILAIVQGVSVDRHDALAAAERALAHDHPSAAEVTAVALSLGGNAARALSLGEQALAALPPERAVDVVLAVQLALVRVGTPEQVATWMPRLEAVAPEDPRWAQAQLAVGRLWQGQGELERAADAFLGVAAGPDRSAARAARVELGVVRLMQGRAVEAKPHLYEARAQLEPGSWWWARATEMLALALKDGDHDLAGCQSLLETAIEAFTHLEDPLRVATARSNLGVVLSRLGRVQAALDVVEQARETLEQLGDLRGLLLVDNNCGVWLDWSGQPERAMLSFERAMLNARRLGDRRVEALALCNWAARRGRQGPLSEVLETFDRALELAEGFGLLMNRVRLYRVRILENSAEPGALAVVDQLIEAGPDASDWDVFHEALAMRAALRGRLGDLPGGQDDLGRAVAMMSAEPFNAASFAISGRAQVELALAAGDSAGARERLGHILRTLDAHGVHPRSSIYSSVSRLQIVCARAE